MHNCVSLLFLQVKFDGVTGFVSFDDAGFRSNFKLDVLELGLNSEPKKVSKVGDKTFIILLNVVAIYQTAYRPPSSPPTPIRQPLSSKPVGCCVRWMASLWKPVSLIYEHIAVKW